MGVRERSDPAGPAVDASRASQPHICGFTKQSQANRFPHLLMELAARLEGLEVETGHSPVDRGQGAIPAAPPQSRLIFNEGEGLCMEARLLSPLTGIF